MNVFTALGISVAAGIVVVALSLLTKLVWHWFLENLYLKLACRHLSDISGEWTADYEQDGWLCHDETSLKQFGYKIEGASKMKMSKDGQRDIVKHFVIHGILRNDLFSGYYYNRDRRQKGSGCFTYVVTGMGKLDGEGVFYDVEADKILHTAYTLEPAAE